MKKQISSGSAFEAEYAYSRAVIDGQYVFVSGTTGYDYATMTISEDVVKQTEQCFENIQQALEAAGCGWADVVRIHYLLTHKDDFAHCAPVLRQYLSDSRPAATMMVVGLLDDKMKIEIEVTARLPG